MQNYKRGRYGKARAEYERLAGKKPNDARLRYNAGTAAFQDGDYENALRHFSSSLSATDLKLQQSGYYNLGNTQYRLGDKADDPKEKQQAWEQAIHDYENALKLNPQDADAKFNLDVVKQKLEELKKQQQQQQNQQNEDDKKDDQDKKDQEKQDQQKQDQQKQDKKDQQDQQKQDKQDQQQSGQDKKEDQQKQDEAKKQDQAKGDDKKQQDQMTPQDQRGQEPDKAAQAAQYSKVMQMTPQQAMQLLEAQKAEEKAMIFVPQNLRTNKNNNTRQFKDW